jgi:hypothetical protein
LDFSYGFVKNCSLEKQYKTISFSCNDPWTLSSSVSWCTVTFAYNGPRPQQKITGNSGDNIEIEIWVEANYSFDNREATITISQKNVVKEIIVNQEGITDGSPPTNTSVGLVDQSIVIKWNALPPATSYKVYRNGILINEVKSSVGKCDYSVEDNSFLGVGVYYYSIQAFMGTNKVGSQSPDMKYEIMSSECDILTFKVSGIEWVISGVNINFTYTNSKLGVVRPLITVSSKAKVFPASWQEVDFSDGKEVIYTVTAEDGTQKIYTAKAITTIEDKTLLYGKWKMGDSYYRYNSNGTYAYWYAGLGGTEENSHIDRWEIEDFTLIHKSRFEGYILNKYLILELTSTTLIHKSIPAGWVSTFVKVE